MAARVKNIASADDLKRALLQKVPKLDPAQYMHLCTETVASSYLASYYMSLRKWLLD